MSNAGYLLERYLEHPQLQTLIQMLERAEKRIWLRGLVGAQKALVAAAVVRRTGRLLVWICTDKEEAAYSYNDLQAFLGEADTAFFPDSFRRPAVFDHLNPTQVLQRSEVVSRLSLPHRRGWAVVTYPEALFEQVVAPEVLTKSRIELVKGERVDLDFVLQVLVEYGLVRTDFVYEPGQFSLRGGILDLFSFGNEFPYRIELLDDEIESIRTFDPLTQLSRQKIERVRILPHWETAHRPEDKVPFPAVLLDDAIVWMEDVALTVDRLLHCFEAAEEYAVKISTLEDDKIRALLAERAFVRPADVLASLRKRTLLFSREPTDELPL